MKRAISQFHGHSNQSALYTSNHRHTHTKHPSFLLAGNKQAFPGPTPTFSQHSPSVTEIEASSVILNVGQVFEEPSLGARRPARGLLVSWSPSQRDLIGGDQNLEGLSAGQTVILGLYEGGEGLQLLLLR